MLELRRRAWLVVAGLAVTAPAAARDAILRIPASVAGQAQPVALTAEIWRPAGQGRFPAVVMMHGCGGWQAPVQHALREHANFLRDNGFVVLNLDSFGPRGLAGGGACEDNGRLVAALRYRTHDAFDALRFLRTLDYVAPEQIYLMGQSNGGSVAMLAVAAGASRTFMGNETGYRGAIAFYPWCGTYGTTRPQLEAPLLMLTGARDDWTPSADCARMRSWGAEARAVVYPGAAHSFDVLAPEHRYLGNLVGYDATATADGRQQMLGFLRAHGAAIRDTGSETEARLVRTRSGARRAE